MRKTISHILPALWAVSLMFTIGASAQTSRRQRPNRVRTPPNVPQRADSTLVSSAERKKQELIKLFDLAGKAEAMLRSNQSDSEFAGLHAQLRATWGGGAIQFNVDGSTLKAMADMIDAYAGAHTLSGLATYKPPSIEEVMLRERIKEAEDRPKIVERIRELRRRAFGESDPITRRELLAQANLEEASLKYSNSEPRSWREQRAAKTIREEGEEVNRRAALIADKYGVKDKWAADPLKAVQEIVDIAARHRLELKKQLEGQQ